MSSAPAFQFYPSDFLSSTLHFTPAQTGVYIRLLSWSWLNGPLPLDTPSLMAIAGVTKASNWPQLWLTVKPKWTKNRDGFCNKRLEKIRAAQEVYRQIQSAKGVKSSMVKQFNRGSTTVDNRLASGCNQTSTLRSSISDLRSSDQKQDLKDWFDECKELHHGKCQSSYIHAQQCGIDKLRGLKSAL